MLISVLSKYYDYLRSRKNGDMVPEHYSKVKIHYLVCLSEEGDIENIIPYTHTVTMGKKQFEQPNEEIFPERIQFAGIKSYIAEHRPNYLFGITSDKNCLTEDEKAKKSFSAFKETNREFFSDIASPVAKAFIKFIDKWKPSEQLQNPYLLSVAKDIKTSNFAFCLSNSLTNLLNNDPEVVKKWEKTLDISQDNDAIQAQCSVCGEIKPIARINEKIIGLSGGLAVGTTLVCCKNTSEWSYGKEQAFNSSISYEVMKKYTAALNYLISKKEHKIVLDEMTLIYFAMTNENEEKYLSFFESYIKYSDVSGSDADNENQKELDNILKSLSRGIEPDYQSFNLNKNVEFYVFGLVPNQSRIAVKLFYINTFGDMLKNLSQHRKDFSIDKEQRQIYLKNIANEIKSPKSSNENAETALTSQLLLSILNGSLYPQKLLSSVVKRVKIDQDTEKDNYIKFNITRMGIIKAYLNRKNRILNKKEEITMALNSENSNPAYLCGRLFAVLEKAQQNALGDVNSTIRDRFFASACSTPGLVFPRLLRLAQNHIAKDDKHGVFSDRLIQQITGLMGNTFPKSLSIENQGVFILGYYQQREDLYTKKEDKLNGNN